MQLLSDEIKWCNSYVDDLYAPDFSATVEGASVTEPMLSMSPLADEWRCWLGRHLRKIIQQTKSSRYKFLNYSQIVNHIKFTAKRNMIETRSDTFSHIASQVTHPYLVDFYRERATIEQKELDKLECLRAIVEVSDHSYAHFLLFPLKKFFDKEGKISTPLYVPPIEPELRKWSEFYPASDPNYKEEIFFSEDEAAFANDWLEPFQDSFLEN